MNQRRVVKRFAWALFGQLLVLLVVVGFAAAVVGVVSLMAKYYPAVLAYGGLVALAVLGCVIIVGAFRAAWEGARDTWRESVLAERDANRAAVSEGRRRG